MLTVVRQLLPRKSPSSSVWTGGCTRFATTTASALTKKKTPLYDLHIDPKLKGKMIGFAGYEMPLSYEGSDETAIAGGPVAEHHHVRKSSGLFDVSHMVQSTFSGPGALGFLSKMLPASLSTMPVPSSPSETCGSSLSVLLNEEGGIIDDCMITRWGLDKFYLVTNAACAERDLAWLQSNLALWNSSSPDLAEMEILDRWGLIALQGPTSHMALQRLLPSSFPLTDLLFGRSVFIPLPSLSSPNENVALHIARGGYTGEDGFEISVPEKYAEKVARMLLEQPEVKMAGLASRDSLRLEAGLCLYGNDLDELTGVGEAGLNWVVGKDRREAGSFMGSKRTLAELKKGGCSRKRIGLIVEDGPAARGGAHIYNAEGTQQIGIVTSGLPSPTLGQNISMGYIQTKDGLHKKGTPVMVESRRKMRKAEVVGMPWIVPGYYRGL